MPQPLCCPEPNERQDSEPESHLTVRGLGLKGLGWTFDFLGLGREWRNCCCERIT